MMVDKCWSEFKKKLKILHSTRNQEPARALIIFGAVPPTSWPDVTVTEFLPSTQFTVSSQPVPSSPTVADLPSRPKRNPRYYDLSVRRYNAVGIVLGRPQTCLSSTSFSRLSDTSHFFSGQSDAQASSFTILHRRSRQHFAEIPNGSLPLGNP